MEPPSFLYLMYCFVLLIKLLADVVGNYYYAQDFCNFIYNGRREKMKKTVVGGKSSITACSMRNTSMMFRQKIIFLFILRLYSYYHNNWILKPCSSKVSSPLLSLLFGQLNYCRLFHSLFLYHRLPTFQV